VLSHVRYEVPVIFNIVRALGCIDMMEWIIKAEILASAAIAAKLPVCINISLLGLHVNELSVRNIVEDLMGLIWVAAMTIKSK